MRDAETFPRGLLSEADAAVWLGIGVTSLRKAGIRRRVLGSRKLYDVRDLDEFRNSLPYEDDDVSAAEAACDAAFGL